MHIGPLLFIHYMNVTYISILSTGTPWYPRKHMLFVIHRNTLHFDTLSSSNKFETYIFENVGCRVLQVNDSFDMCILPKSINNQRNS